jgi:hypothetical protein
VAVTKEERLKAQFLIDFAYAESEEEACWKYLEGIQQFMGIATEFLKRVKNIISEISEENSKFAQLVFGAVSSCQVSLRFLLGEIGGRIIYKSLDEIEELPEWLDLYNRLPQVKWIVGYPFGSDTLGRVVPFDEKTYPALENYTDQYDFYEDWRNLLRDGLAHCLIEFLIPSDNRRYLYLCVNCWKSYIAKKIYTTESGLYFCSTPCRMKYHHSQPEYKEKKAAAQRKKHGWGKTVNAK